MRAAALGRDEHDAVRRIRAIDRGRRRVAQHGDTFDVVRVEVVQRVAAGGEPASRAVAEGDAVHDIQRLAAGAHRGGGADAYGEAAVEGIVVDDLHARRLALDY